MVLTKEQADKIKVTEITKVAYINGEHIYAENLQRWAYRRLETWPKLLEGCEEALALLETCDRHFGTHTINSRESIEAAIAAAKA